MKHIKLKRGICVASILIFAFALAIPAFASTATFKNATIPGFGFGTVASGEKSQPNASYCYDTVKKSDTSVALQAATYEVFHTSSGTNYVRQTDDDWINVPLQYISKGWTGRCELRIWQPTASFWGLTVTGSVTF